MPGKARPSLRAKTLENVRRSNLSETDKQCIYAVFEERKPGRWICLEPEIGLFECSECEHKILRAKCNFCPNCGAKMDGDGNG